MNLKSVLKLPQQAAAVVQHPLNKGHASSALKRWLRWHISSRLMLGPALVPFVEQTHLIVEPGMTGATGNIYFGLAEWIDMAFLLHVLRPSDLFIDVGSNIGSFSILAGGVVGARVKAAEPLPSTFAKLQRNIKSNGLANLIKADCIGLSNKRGTLWFTADNDTMNHVIAEPQAANALVSHCPVETLDSWLVDTSPTLIKVDVEGNDLEVMSGALEVLARSSLKALIIETDVSDRQAGPSDYSVFAVLHAHGFAPYDYDPMLRKLSRLEGQQTGGNVIFIRDADYVAARLIDAPRRRLPSGASI